MYDKPTVGSKLLAQHQMANKVVNLLMNIAKHLVTQQTQKRL